METSEKQTAISYDGEVIDVSDIPEVTDFTGWHRRPGFGEKFFKDGKFWVRVHYKDRVEMQEVEMGSHTILSRRVIEEKTSLTV